MREDFVHKLLQCANLRISTLALPFDNLHKGEADFVRLGRQCSLVGWVCIFLKLEWVGILPFLVLSLTGEGWAAQIARIRCWQWYNLAVRVETVFQQW